MRALIADSPVDRARERIADLRSSLGKIEPQRLAHEVMKAYRRNNLLVYAGAISFRAFAAIIPLLLFAIGLLGFLNFQEVWRNDVGPSIRPDVSAAAYKVIDDTITNVLERRQVFWVTLGAAIAIWQTSGAMRMMMKAANQIYDARETRPVRVFLATSVALGVVAAVLILGAVSLVKFGPLLVGSVLGSGTLVGAVAFVIQWLLAIALLLLLVGIVVRFAPARRRPMGWVSFGALLVVVSWIVMSLAFGFYLTYLANYGSLFGNLATVIVALEYVFLSSVVFVTGLQVDALTREEVERR
jgi:membrane protein